MWGWFRPRSRTRARLHCWSRSPQLCTPYPDFVYGVPRRTGAVLREGGSCSPSDPNAGGDGSDSGEASHA
jgi:hypothetical protein